MIKAVFEKSEGGYIGFRMSGHAGYSDEGTDIVCAAVTSAVLLTINGITEILKQYASADVGENKIHFKLPLGSSDTAQDYLASLVLHLMYLSEDYPGTIHLTIMEV